MELVDGCRRAERIWTGPLSEDAACCGWGWTFWPGWAWSTSRIVPHRDPQARQRAADRRARHRQLADFGIAKASPAGRRRRGNCDSGGDFDTDLPGPRAGCRALRPALRLTGGLVWVVLYEGVAGG